MNYKPDASLAFARSITHARRTGRLDHPLHPLDRRLGVLHRRVPAHVPRHACTARTRSRAELVWIFGMLIYLTLMGEAFLRLPAAVGADVLLGRAVIVNLSARCHHRSGPRAVDPRRLRGVRRNAEPLSRCTSSRFPWCFWAWWWCTCSRCMTSAPTTRRGSHIKKYQDTSGRPLDGIPFHPYYTVKDLMGAWHSSPSSARHVLHPEVAATSSSTTTSSQADPLKDAAAHRASLVFHAVLLGPARSPPLFHSQFSPGAAMGAAVLICSSCPARRSPVRSIRYRGPTTRLRSPSSSSRPDPRLPRTESTTVWGQFDFDAFFLDTKDRATWLGGCARGLLLFLHPDALVYGARQG